MGMLPTAWDAALAPGLTTGATLACFLTAAIWLAGEAERCGLAARLADLLLWAARGRAGGLFAAVCVAAAALTALLSLDGAVVVLAPALRALADRGIAVRVALLGAVGVTNASSMILPQGNPANLLVMSGLGMPAPAYVHAMALPGLAATLVCVVAVAVRERAWLAARLPRPAPPTGRLGRGERRALAALVLAAGGEVAGPLWGIAPWWPLCAAAALAWAASGASARALRVPWRLTGLVTVVTGALAWAAASAGLDRLPAPSGAAATAAAALAVGAVAATVNNLPVGAVLGRLVPGPLAYPAVVGLSAGALATPRGSLATILALDLAGPSGPPAAAGYRRLWTPTAVVATALAAGLLGLTAR